MGFAFGCAYRNVLSDYLAPFCCLRNVCLALQSSQEIAYPLLEVAASAMRESDDKLGESD